jgi:WD40-like Beta Propeller Repeat
MCGDLPRRMLRAMKARTITSLLAAAAVCLVAAAPAAADSISYIKDGNIWLTTPDGARQVQVTQGGGYSFASQADDGTLIGLYGRRLHRIARDGRILADFATPVSGEQNGNSVVFEGPFDPAISPDGTKVAYTYNSHSYYTDPGCTGTNCTYRRIEVGVGYSHADRLTSWDEPGLGRQSGWTHPSWIDNSQTLLSERSVIFGNTDSIIDTVGNGNQAFEYWFNDDNAWYGEDGEISRDGKLAAFVAMQADPDGFRGDRLAIYRMNGAARALPEACYHYNSPDGSFDSPSFSPDGKRIAFAHEMGHNPGILVGPLPDVSGGCQLPSADATKIIPGGAEPDWGPADVPAAKIAPPEDDPKKNGPRKLALRLPRGAKLADALRKGIVLTVSPGQAGKAVASAKAGKAKVAKGSTKVGRKGSAKLKLRFTGKAKRSLRRKKSVRLAVTVKFTPKGGGAAQAASAALRLNR